MSIKEINKDALEMLEALRQYPQIFKELLSDILPKPRQEFLNKVKTAMNAFFLFILNLLVLVALIRLYLYFIH